MQISYKTKHRDIPCGYIRKDIYGVYKLVFINRTNRKHTADMLKELDNMIINCLRKHGFKVGSMYKEGRIRTPKIRRSRRCL